MYRKFTYLTVISSFLLLLFWVANFSLVTPKDLEKCARILRKKEKIATESESLKSSAHQIRHKVQKDIWFSQTAKERLHYRIQSASSLLTLEPTQGKKIEIIENLEKIKCWMQDKIYYSEENTPLQQLRFFEADQGTYRYTSNDFDAKTVMLSLFRLPGHDLPIPTFRNKNAFMRGIAKDVSFSVSGKTPKFQAKQFQASLKPAGKEEEAS